MLHFFHAHRHRPLPSQPGALLSHPNASAWLCSGKRSIAEIGSHASRFSERNNDYGFLLWHWGLHQDAGWPIADRKGDSDWSQQRLCLPIITWKMIRKWTISKKWWVWIQSYETVCRYAVEWSRLWAHRVTKDLAEEWWVWKRCGDVCWVVEGGIILHHKKSFLRTCALQKFWYTYSIRT